jgi:sugar phosphate isomerase/epimerase
MRLGGPVFEAKDPQSWAAEHRRLNYTAAICPPIENDYDIAAYVQAAVMSDIVIAEVGVWNNPLSPVEAERRKAIKECQEKLALADRIGAACCVNIAGSRGLTWDGPHRDNLTEDTFSMILETVRLIIDAVKPVRTYYTLETMPWMYPDTTESYNYLVAAIDRKAFGVHFDPVNMISSPQRYYGNARFIREFVTTLGPYIKSVHAKDIRIQEKLTVHLDEVRPGMGELSYHVLLQELDKLNPNIPLILEHLSSPEEYRQAANYIRTVGGEAGVLIKSQR